MLLRAMSKGIGDRKYRDGAGLSMRKIIAVSIAYRSHERPSHIMRAIALSLSDEEIATVARYLAALNK